MDTQVRKYNNQLRELVELALNTSPNNLALLTVERKFRAALACDRTLIIEETGPDLLQYRDMIVDDRWEELAECGKKDLADGKHSEVVKDVGDNCMEEILSNVGDIWLAFEERQQKYVTKSLKKLLSYCIKYYKAKAAGKF